MRTGCCKNAQTDTDSEHRNSYQQEGKEIRRMYTMLFFVGRNGEVVVQKRKPGSGGIWGMQDSFAGQNIRGIIRTACHQAWEEDGEQRAQEETGSKARTKSFGARKRGSARTRSLSGQIGSYSIEKTDKWNYREKINVSFFRESWKQREIRGSASVTARRKRKAPVVPGARPKHT